MSELERENVKNCLLCDKKCIAKDFLSIVFASDSWKRILELRGVEK
jgi:hypothetical protein